MIALREANTKVDLLLKQHVAFVENRVGKVIDFYIDIFKVIPEIQKARTTEKNDKGKHY